MKAVKGGVGEWIVQTDDLVKTSRIITLCEDRERKWGRGSHVSRDPCRFIVRKESSCFKPLTREYLEKSRHKKIMFCSSSPNFLYDYFVAGNQLFGPTSKRNEVKISLP